jgi:hypothetical protein
MQHHLSPVITAIIKRLRSVSAGEDMEKMEPLHTVGGKIN